MPADSDVTEKSKHSGTDDKPYIEVTTARDKAHLHPEHKTDMNEAPSTLDEMKAKDVRKPETDIKPQDPPKPPTDTMKGLTPDSRDGMSFIEALDKGLFDPVSGQIHDPETGKDMSLSNAIESGMLDLNSTAITHPSTHERIPLSEAIEQGLVDDAGNVKDPVTGKVMPLEEALSTALPADFGVIDKMKHSDTGDKPYIEVTTVLDKAPLHPDPKTDVNETSLGSAEAAGDVPGKYKYAGSEKDITLGDAEPKPKNSTKSDEAPDLPFEGSLMTEIPVLPETDTFVPAPDQVTGMTLIEALDKKLFDPVTGLVSDPTGPGSYSLEDAMKMGIIDGATPQLVNPDTGQSITPLDALHNGLLDPNTGQMIHPVSGQVIPLDKALDKGFIKIPPTEPPKEGLSFVNALESGLFDPKSCLVTDPNSTEKLSILDALTKGLLDNDLPQIKDPATGKDITLQEAIDKGLFDPDSGTLLDPDSNTKIPIEKAVDKGLLVKEPRQSMTLTEALNNGLFDPKTGTITDPTTAEKLSLSEALERDILDSDTPFIKDPNTGNDLTLKEAIDKDLIDPQTGHVKEHTPERASATEGLADITEHVIPADTGDTSRVEITTVPDKAPDPMTIKGVDEIMEDKIPPAAGMTLVEALDRNVFDPITGLVTDPVSGERMAPREAIEKGVLLDTPQVLDSTSSRLVPLSEAVHSGLVDSTSGAMQDPVTGDFIPLGEARGKGLILDLPAGKMGEGEGKGGEPEDRPGMSLQEAIRQGHFHPTSGLFTDPESSKQYNLAEAIQAGLIDPTKREITPEREEEPEHTSTEPSAQEPVPDLMTDIVQAGVVHSGEHKHEGVHIEETVPLVKSVGVEFTAAEALGFRPIPTDATTATLEVEATDVGTATEPDPSLKLQEVRRVSPLIYLYT